jgi:predicted regulator of Ras-like GTPase activity (Roadblock/LC7/MglB family)
MPLGERIILSEEISDQLDAYLKDFIANSEARAAFLITKGGQLLVQQGISKKSSRLFSIVSLISGIFSSTQRLSTLVGEAHFKQFYQEGRRYSVYYSSLIEPFVFVTIFDDKALLGDVQLRVEEMEDRLRHMLVMTVRDGMDMPFINLTSRTPEEAFTDLFDFNV